MPEALAALDANVRKALAVHGQQVAVQQALLCSLVVAELALMHLRGGTGRQPGLRAAPLQLVCVQDCGSLGAGRVCLHVAVQHSLLVGAEGTVFAPVLPAALR